ncbi:hypothetical protein BD324DRAFT_653148 [Kockovaella imperatae]|uniref:Uncharacterized protein n=1 Tax=Kockovaella imperatae TaxID=4999 RepID=A0A1Y1U8K1_9TREE|nr:hypothetical protein BD324DRAFT_653148 [Kockovaella imperatae]ORX34370.1 hypothetical protein BD324DRAFT_653148 [Kockovaella imperatae]
MSDTQYSGSLLNKRKAELSEIASSLGLADPDAKMTELIKTIQDHLEKNEKDLMSTPKYKGLYVRKGRVVLVAPRHHDTETPAPEVVKTVEGTVKKPRKSMNKALDRIADAIDPANIALPESPINVSKIQHEAQQLSKALVPSNGLPKDVSVRARQVSNKLVKIGRDSQSRVDKGVSLLREYLSNPEHIVASALAVELAFLFAHVLQFYDHTIFFPPPGGASGTFPSLFHSLFFWMPKFHLDMRIPDAIGLGYRAEIWPAVSWWFSTTVLPALAGSTVITFGKTHKARSSHAGRGTTSQSGLPRPDPFTFALFRFALLLYPLTSAAPSSLVDALEMSGNLQGRALGAGLLAMLLLAERLQ